MKKFVVAFSLALVAMVATVSEASIFGSSYQKVTNARIEIFKGGTWQKAQLGVDIVLTGPNSLSESASSIAMLGAVVDSAVTGSSTDVAPAYVGPGAGPADNAGFTPGVIPPGAVSSYSFADTESLGGTIVSAGGPPNPGAGLQLIASTDVSSPAVDSFATGSALLGADIRAQFAVLSTADFRFVADVISDIDISIVPPPIGFMVSAISAFKVSLSGTAAGIGASTLNFQPAGANALINSFVSTSYFFSGTVTSNAVTLGGQGLYNFDLSSTVSVAAISSIPEPTSVAVFGIMGLGTLVGVRRRKAKVS